MAKRNVSEIETGAGFFMGFSNGLMDVVREKAVPFAAIYRLATGAGRATLAKIVDLAYADWQAEQPKPVEPSTHSGHPYRNGGGQATSDIIWVGEVAVDYGARPSFRELDGDWFDWANERFGNTTPELRQLDAKPLPTSGIVTRRYGYVHLNRNATDEQALKEIAKRHVVPATDLEAMYFGKAFPEEQRKFPIVALRSFFRLGRHFGSAVLYEFGSERCLLLDFGTVACPWDGGDRFLVREDGE